MKKYTLLCVGLCAAMTFTSCKSSESAYKKAYEKAKQYDTATAQASNTDNSAVVAPVEARPATETRVVDNLDYDAQIVKNEDKNMYRVVASTFAGKADAVYSRDQLRATYPDAWLLYNAR